MGYPQAAILALALCILVPGRAAAQADTAYAREVHGQVQKELAQMQRIHFTFSQPGIPVREQVSAWSQGKDVRKIQVIAPDDSGDVVSEYFYAKGALVFVYMAVKGYTPAGAQRTGIEHRQYFRDGRMIRWLGGMEKVELSDRDPDYRREEKDRLAYSAGYLGGVRLARGKQASGTVTQLVNADVACNITLKDERGAEFRESGDFELCSAKPSPIGKRVQLSYGIENVMAEACKGDPDCGKSDRIALVVAMKVEQPAGTLCTVAESVVFSCRAGAKIASVCASKGAGRAVGSLQYRFGLLGQPQEIAVPEPAAAPAKAATGENVPFAGGGGSWLRFRKGDHAYVAYSGIGKWGPKGETREKQGVVVEQAGKAIAHVKCNAKGEELPGRDWFERMGITPGKEEFLFPD